MDEEMRATNAMVEKFDNPRSVPRLANHAIPVMKMKT
jgi:hypothetical protein